jgi:hypothetical protein
MEAQKEGTDETEGWKQECGTDKIFLLYLVNMERSPKRRRCSLFVHSLTLLCKNPKTQRFVNTNCAVLSRTKLCRAVPFLINTERGCRETLLSQKLLGVNCIDSGWDDAAEVVPETTTLSAS